MAKRILIITAFFEENFQYQEIQIADTLHSMKYDVTVLTTDRSYFLKDKHRRVTFSSKPYPVIRLTDLIRITDTVFVYSGLRKTLSSLAFDTVLLIYPSHGLGYFALRHIQKEVKVISFFQEHTGISSYTKFKNKFIKFFIKNIWYREIFKRSFRIAAITPETIERFKNNAMFRSLIWGKIGLLGLGFNPDMFYYNDILRSNLRNTHGIPENGVVLITVTRILEYKPVWQWIQPIIEALSVSDSLYYILIGFTDSSYSIDLKAKIKEAKLNNRIILLDILNPEKINQYFCCADYGIWFIAASISIQQSMGTGLPVILPANKIFEHLITPSENGFYYSSGPELKNLLISLSNEMFKREEVLAFNQKFSYRFMLKELLGN